MKKINFCWILIFSGLLLIFCLPFEITGDGVERFQALSALLSQGRLTLTRFSLMGPLFAAPLWIIGGVLKSPGAWCARFNALLFVIGLFLFYRLFAQKLERRVLLTFLLLLIAGTWLSVPLRGFYGDTFTMLTVAVGLTAVSFGWPLTGWPMCIAGVVNTPAAVVGFAINVV